MYRLCEVERKILSIAQADADLPCIEIARRLNLKQHTVRYALTKLQEAGVIQRLTCVNLAKIGYGEYFLVVNIKDRSPASQKRLVETIKQSDHVVWLLELGGEYHLGVVYLASSILDATLFVEELCSRSEVEFSKKILSLRVARAYFGVKHLSPIREQRRFDMGTIGAEAGEWDHTDHEILHALASNTVESPSTIARLLGKPESTILYRLKLLKQKGILHNTVYYIHPESYGMASYRLHVAMLAPSAKLRESLHLWACNHPNVLAAFHSLGPWDFELRVEVPDFRGAMQLAQELNEKFSPNVSKVEVIPAFALQALCHYPFRQWPTAGDFFCDRTKQERALKVSNSG